MHKNQRGFTVISVVLFTILLSLIGAAGWRTYEQGEHSNEQSKPSQQITTEKAQSNQNNNPRDYPVPTAPTGLRAVAAGQGVSLSWEVPASTGGIDKYQIFYQGNFLADSTVNSYLHTLPPPPPGCTPISLSYYVKAVDAAGGTSVPSATVTIQTGGC